MVRNEAVYVRRRRVALLGRRGLRRPERPGCDPAGRVPLRWRGRGGLHADTPPRSRSSRSQRSRCPKPSPVEAQGDPGPSTKTAMVRILRLDRRPDPEVGRRVDAGPRLRPEHDVHAHGHGLPRRRCPAGGPIDDSVDLAKFGVPGHAGTSKGSPVETAFTPDGRYAWVSNYSMYGKGYGPEGLRHLHQGRRHLTQHGLPDRHQDVRHRPGRRRRLGAQVRRRDARRQDRPGHQLVLVGPVHHRRRHRARRRRDPVGGQVPPRHRGVARQPHRLRRADGFGQGRAGRPRAPARCTPTPRPATARGTSSRARTASTSTSPTTATAP